jgi:hypothetical protein
VTQMAAACPESVNKSEKGKLVTLEVLGPTMEKI